MDWSDAAGLARAATECDAAVHLVGVLKETPAQRYADAHEGTARALAAAAKQSGLHRIVYLSIIGADVASRNACLASKARAEAILLAPPLATTVLRLPMVLGGDDPATWALRARSRAAVVPLVRGGASLEQPIDARRRARRDRRRDRAPGARGPRARRRGPGVAAPVRARPPHRGAVRKDAALRGDPALRRARLCRARRADHRRRRR